MPPENKNDGEDKGGKEDATAEVLKGLKESISSLPQSMQESVSRGVTASLQRMQEEAAQKDDDEDEEDEKSSGDSDLESMDRSQFANYLVGVIKREVGKDFKEISKRQQEDRLASARDKLQTQLKEAQANHPDFLLYKNEIASLAETYSDLTPEDLYILAKARNPEKTREIEEKNAEEKKKKEEEEHKAQRQRFAGLTPTSGVSIANSGKMSQADAANAAWDEAMAGLPKELIGSG